MDCSCQSLQLESPNLIWGSPAFCPSLQNTYVHGERLILEEVIVRVRIVSFVTLVQEDKWPGKTLVNYTSSCIGNLLIYFDTPRTGDSPVDINEHKFNLLVTH